MKVYETEKDGLPDMDNLTGRVAFIFDGCIVSGWPLHNVHLEYPENNFPVYGTDVWEANTDVGHNKPFRGVKKYIIFDVPICEM